MNTIKLVSYDLIAPGRAYTRLIEAIKNLSPKSWARPLESTWLIPTSLSCSAIRDALKPVMDANDQLFVLEMTGNWAALRLDPAVSDWLKQPVS